MNHHSENKVFRDFSRHKRTVRKTDDQRRNFGRKPEQFVRNWTKTKSENPKLYSVFVFTEVLVNKLRQNNQMSPFLQTNAFDVSEQLSFGRFRAREKKGKPSMLRSV